MTYAIIALILLVVAMLAVALVVHHQRSLKMQAYLMREAIRNHDFTYHLPTKGLLSGERAMLETLNQLGGIIHQQISLNEVEAWERLTRVLTHEIMNATAPIASISQSLLRRTDVKGTPLEEGIQTIQTTSQHLTTFVDSYRKLSQLQRPIIETVNLASLVREVTPLYPTLLWTSTIPDDSNINADPNMLRQIFINLAKNAAEADARHICIEISYNPTTIYVSNDGHPIPPEAIRSIFIPFFTTKRTGNGIGLSLARRMMMQQGGMLNLEDISRGGFHTTFSLEWFDRN